VLGHARAARRARGPEPDRRQQLQQVVVLGEAEQARDELLRAEQRARSKVVLAFGKGEHERQRELELPDRVADVQPDPPAVRSQEARAHDPRQHDHRRDAVAIARGADESRIEPPPVRARVRNGQRGAAGAHPGQERLEPAVAAVTPVVFCDRVVLARLTAPA
jgi:hypothetical protein